MNEVRHGSNRWLAYCFLNRCSTRSSWTIALNSLKFSYIASKRLNLGYENCIITNSHAHKHPRTPTQPSALS